MKIDVAHKISQFVNVKLDGAIMHYCISADEDAGVVVAYKLDRNIGSGARLFGDIPTQTLTGRVEIVLADDAPDWVKAEYAQMRD